LRSIITTPLANTAPWLLTTAAIFLRDGLLFSYLEYTGDDWAAAQAQIAADSETRRWWQLTDPMQEPLKTAAEGEWWAPAEEVFHLA
jgi:L-rhamnose mutarotase